MLTSGAEHWREEEAISMDLAIGLVIGIVVGAFIGFLLAPAAQVWVGRKEWTEASRQLELADRLLETLGEPVDSGQGPA